MAPQAPADSSPLATIAGDVIAYAVANPLEGLGAALGLLCVWLLTRQNILTWPLGMLYGLISTWLFLQVNLYGQVALNLYFVAMNLYGWYWWRRGTGTEDTVPVTRVAPVQLVVLLAGSAALVAVLALGFGTWSDARLPWLDMGITVLSVGAMWLAARKKLENWACWLVIDVASVALFALVGAWFYALLYLIYVPMAVRGHLLWARSMHNADQSGPRPLAAT